MFPHPDQWPGFTVACTATDVISTVFKTTILTITTTATDPPAHSSTESTLVDLVVNASATTTALIGDERVAFNVQEPQVCSEGTKDDNTQIMIWVTIIPLGFVFIASLVIWGCTGAWVPQRCHNGLPGPRPQRAHVRTVARRPVARRPDEERADEERADLGGPVVGRPDEEWADLGGPVVGRPDEERADVGGPVVGWADEERADEERADEERADGKKAKERPCIRYGKGAFILTSVCFAVVGAILTGLSANDSDACIHLPVASIFGTIYTGIGVILAAVCSLPL